VRSICTIGAAWQAGGLTGTVLPGQLPLPPFLAHNALLSGVVSVGAPVGMAPSLERADLFLRSLLTMPNGRRS
jgi:hypothetical protein